MTRTLALLLVCSAAPAAAARAQDSVPPAVARGSLVLGGGASISRTRNELSSSTGLGSSTDDVTTLAIAPSLLYFVRPGLAVGGEASLAYFDRDGGSSTSFGVGPAVRYYFARGATRTLPYLGASVRVGRVSNDADEGASSSATQWGLEGTAGITWLLSRQVGVLGEAYVGRFSQDLGAQQGVGTLDVTSTAFGVRFGIAAFLPRAR